MVLGKLVEVRPGRKLYVQTVYGDPRGELAHCSLVALLVHGAMCHHSQVLAHSSVRGDSMHVVAMETAGLYWWRSGQGGSCMCRPVWRPLWRACALRPGGTAGARRHVPPLTGMLTDTPVADLIWVLWCECCYEPVDAAMHS